MINTKTVKKLKYGGNDNMKQHIFMLSYSTILILPKQYGRKQWKRRSDIHIYKKSIRTLGYFSIGL